MADNTAHIFAYWEGSDQTPIAPMLQEWRASFPAFRVLGDEDIVPLLEEHHPDHLDTYRAIRLPAAKSDIARLLAMHEWGGLYVDCHYGLTDPEGVQNLLGQLQRFDAIFVDHASRRPGYHRFINGVLLGRPRLPLFRAIAETVLRNLEQQRAAEVERGYVPYNLYLMTGACVIGDAVLQLESDGERVRPELADRINIVPEETLPMQRDQWRTYTVKGRQWHVRQQSELLFEPAAAAANG